NDPGIVPERLEAVVARMWAEGWRRDDDNVNLFATDFGSILTDALHHTLRGLLVFRSRTALSHASLWWDALSVEAFPFHRVFRRLIHEEGESLSYYARRLTDLVRQ